MKEADDDSSEARANQTSYVESLAKVQAVTAANTEAILAGEVPPNQIRLNLGGHDASAPNGLMGFGCLMGFGLTSGRGIDKTCACFFARLHFYGASRTRVGEV